MIAAFLEPWSPHRDKYCLSSVILPEEGKSIVEVVGPGFDTSDLVRGDLLPHERFELQMPSQLVFGSSILTRPRSTYIATAEEYKRSVEERLRKIGARLKDSAYPREVLEREIDKREDLRADAIQYLKRTKQTLLLNHMTKYVPIPRTYVSRFLTGAFRVLVGLRRHDIDLGTVTFSGTFTSRGRFFFWDFFPADSKKGALLMKG
jgi:hypothetical protein